MFNKNELLIISTENKQLPFKNATIVSQKQVSDFLEFSTAIKEAIQDDNIKCIVIDSFTRILSMVSYYLEDVQKITGYKFWKHYAVYLEKMLMYSMLTNKWVVWLAIDDIQFNADGEEIRSVKIKGNELKGLIESYFTIVLFTHVDSKKSKAERYQFCTNSDGRNTAKTPMGMFAKDYIPNDMESVFTQVSEYYGFAIDNYEVKRPNILVVGRSGSGKSTSLRNLVQ